MSKRNLSQPKIFIRQKSDSYFHFIYLTKINIVSGVRMQVVFSWKIVLRLPQRQIDRRLRSVTGISMKLKKSYSPRKIRGEGVMLSFCCLRIKKKKKKQAVDVYNLELPLAGSSFLFYLNRKVLTSLNRFSFKPKNRITTRKL